MLKELYLHPQKSTASDQVVRNSIGGRPIVPKGYGWPICQDCGEKMVLFLQFDIPQEIAKYKGYHLTIFMSPEINEAPHFDDMPEGKTLSKTFWNEWEEEHFQLFFFKGEEEILKEEDEYLEFQEIEFKENGHDDMIRLGGEPNWLQDPEIPIGADQESFDFLLQITENFPFPKKASSPEQPDSFSVKDYCLFLGLQSYFFVSSEIPHPEAVWVTAQD